VAYAVVGAGPVGLTLAIDLAQRGIDVLVTEIRHRGEPPNVKCNHVAARSMEVFRRLGVAQALRDAGLPADYPNDVAYRTAVAGMELSRIPIPARRDRYTATGGPDTWWPTAEPPHRINQIFLEPVLFAHAEATPGLRIRNRTRIDDFEQDDDGVWATGVDLDDGRAVRIRCRTSWAATAPAPRCARRSAPAARHRRGGPRAVDLLPRACAAGPAEASRPGPPSR
jgi:2-polyprenyl-6-methoxyphenol hydroxylase-like FAD-dependent oxidoreductase